MPIELQMLHDSRIAHYIFSDPWNPQEMQAVQNSIIPFLDTATGPVHALVDLTRARQDPIGMLQTRTHPTFKHRNRGYIVLVGPSLLITRLAEVGFKLIGYKDIRFFETAAEGMDFIQSLLATERR